MIYMIQEETTDQWKRTHFASPTCLSLMESLLAAIPVFFMLFSLSEETFTSAFVACHRFIQYPASTVLRLLSVDKRDINIALYGSCKIVIAKRNVKHLKMNCTQGIRRFYPSRKFETNHHVIVFIAFYIKR